jgi:hypothetical protein
MIMLLRDMKASFRPEVEGFPHHKRLIFSLFSLLLAQDAERQKGGDFVLRALVEGDVFAHAAMIIAATAFSTRMMVRNGILVMICSGTSGQAKCQKTFETRIVENHMVSLCT